MKSAALTAPTVRELLERLKLEYGPEAVVYSVRRTADNLVEMKVATDCDWLSPKLRAVLADTREALRQAGSRATVQVTSGSAAWPLFERFPGEGFRRQPKVRLSTFGH